MDCFDLRDLQKALRLDERNPDGEYQAAAVTSWFGTSDLAPQTQRSFMSEKGLNEDLLSRTLTSQRWPNHVDTEWAKFLDDAVGSLPGSTLPKIQIAYSGIPVSDLPFPEYFQPFVAYTLLKIKSPLTKLNLWNDDLQVSLAESIVNQLLEISFLTLQEDYEGSPLDYQSYRSLYDSCDGYRRLFKEYPVLARLTATVCKNFIANIVEPMIHFLDDFDDLIASQILRPAVDGDTITSVSLGLGDSHQGGRSVLSITFGGQKLYYRPRSAPEFSLFNAAVSRTDISLPKVPHLNRTNHCWVAYLEQAEYAEVDLTDFFVKFGGLAALLHCFGAKDMHFENIIGTSAGPIPVDLETLLHPLTQSRPSDAQEAAVQYLNDSPLGTGVFPVTANVGEQSSIEASAILGGLITSKTTIDRIEFINGTPTLQKVTVERLPSKSLPKHMSMEDVRDHIPHIVEGFQEALNKILNEKGALLDLAASYSRNSCRVLLRPTYLYDACLRTLRHPTYMKSMLAREHFLLRLWKAHSDSKFSSAVIDAEVTSLLVQDIPFFQAEISSRMLLAPPTGDALQKSALDRFTERLTGSTISMTQQRACVLVEESLNAGCIVQRKARKLIDQPLRPISESVMRELCEILYQKFIETAFITDNDVTWVGFSSSKDSESLRLAPLGDTLYDGLGGIAVALGAYYSISNDESAAKLVQLCLTHLERLLDELGAHSRLPVGAFSGISGFLYSYAKSSELIGESPAYLRANESQLVQMLERTASKDQYLDLSSGSAGALCVLHSLVSDGIWSNQSTLKTTSSIAEYLISKHDRVTGKQGIAWKSGHEGIYLGGMSHGVSGVAMGLACASALTGNKAFGRYATQALMFDDNYYDEQTSMWQDIREDASQRNIKTFPNHWCHGAAGIAAARARVRQLLSANELEHLCEAGRRSFSSAPAPENSSLCHGELGNALCAKTIDPVCYRHSVDQAVHNLTTGTPRVGIELELSEVPGLMVGHAGILFGLCAALNDAVPNVLILE